MGQGVKRVLITGVSSFGGCHLAMGYKAMGLEVVGTTGPSWQVEGIRAERLDALRQRDIRLVSVDMRDGEAIRHCVEEIVPDVWVQHAGYTKAYASPDYDMETGFLINVKPLKAIYAAMGEARGKVILTGTVAEYSDSDDPHEEADVCAPSMPYGLSKLTATMYARQLASRHAVPTRVARLFLPFGPLDAPEKMLSSTIRALKEGRTIELSPCSQRRDILYVDDMVALYQKLLGDFGRSEFEIYNVCSGESPTLKEVLLEFAQILEADPTLCKFGAIPLRPGEPLVIQGSNSKARAHLGWTPTPRIEALRKICAEFS